MSKIDIQTIKDKLAIDDICNVVESLGGTKKGENRKYIIYSSICHNLDADNGEHKSKLYINKDNLSWTCFVCNCTQDIFELVKRKKALQGVKYNFPQCIKYVCDVVGIDCKSIEQGSDTNIYNWSSLKRYLKKESLDIELKEYDKSILNYFDNKYYQSWLDEGFEPYYLDKWGIKWYDYKQQIIIPVFDCNGILRGIRSRNIVPNDIQEIGKYIPTKLLDGTQFNFPSQQLLYGECYNFENIKKYKSVILTESEKSVIKSDQWYNKSITLGMIGHNLSDYNLKRLIEIGVNEVTIALDFDFTNKDSEEYEKYVKNVNKIYYKCSPYFKVYVLTFPKNKNKYYKWSPFDFTKEQYEWFWQHRERIE